MKRVIVGLVLVLFTFLAWHTVTLAQNGEAPTVAFDITKADLDYVRQNAPAGDRQLRVVDMGKYNMGVGLIYRGPTNDKPGDPISVLYHDYTPETYIITSGSGILTTGGVIENKRAGQGVPNVMNGPGGGGTAGAGAYSRLVKEGDIIIIPNKVAHGWSQITDHVEYLSVRPDPDRVLPGGFVYPLLLRNQPTPAPAGAQGARGAGAGRGAAPAPGRGATPTPRQRH
jgi:hypothetical protein